MNNWDYVREVSALRAPEHLRRKVAALPEWGKDSPPRAAGATSFGGRHRISRWGAIAAALVLVVGLGVAAPAILRAFTTGGDLTTPPPPVAATPTAPAGIVAGGIDVSPVILNAAKEYVGQQLIVHAALPGAAVLVDGEFQEGPSAVYDNWRIDGLEPCYERKELGDYTISVYRLDYRLHTTTPERVPLAGAAEVDEEGWALVTYPHSTYLVFILNYSTNHYFSTMINDSGPGNELFDQTIKAEIDTYIAGLGGDAAADPWGITLRTEDVTPTGLTLVIEQSGGAPTGRLQTGRAYTLERYANETWTPVETASGKAPAWTLEAQSIPTEDSVRWEIDFQPLYYALTPGEYRIGKEIMNSRADGDYDERVYYAEFSIITPDLFPTLDFYAYKDVMSDEEWEAMEGFLPVLLEGATFSRTDGTTFEAQGDITLDEFLPEFWGEGLESNQLHLWRLAVADADGDGKRELVLALKDAAYCYLVLHREGDKFYSIDFPVRWFQGLQTNGVYGGSGGAAYQSYYKMTFENGTFVEENLGNEAWSSDTDGTFDIGGQAVDADTFVAWRDELMVGDVTWYDHVSKTWT